MQSGLYKSDSANKRAIEEHKNNENKAKLTNLEKLQIERRKIERMRENKGFKGDKARKEIIKEDLQNKIKREKNIRKGQ